MDKPKREQSWDATRQGGAFRRMASMNADHRSAITGFDTRYTTPHHPVVNIACQINVDNDPQGIMQNALRDEVIRIVGDLRCRGYIVKHDLMLTINDNTEIARLTHREREVLELIATGMRASKIADNLFLTIATVRSNIRSILTKLDVGSQLEAVALLHQLPEAPAS